MLHLLADPNAWASLLTLTALEIVLGVDNIIFLSIVSGRLPVEQQRRARRIGLIGAAGMRVLLLLAISWLVGMTAPLFTLFDQAVSLRDIVLGGGGLFLMVKGTMEIHTMVEGEHETARRSTVSFAAVIAQIMVLDIVFSLDSVITAVGMAEHIEIMVAAVLIAVGVMLLAAEPTARFVNAYPTVKMLALSFLLLVGVALVADGLHFHIPREYIYFAIAFSVVVEALNRFAANARAKRRGAGT